MSNGIYQQDCDCSDCQTQTLEDLKTQLAEARLEIKSIGAAAEDWRKLYWEAKETIEYPIGYRRASNAICFDGGADGLWYKVGHNVSCEGAPVQLHDKDLGIDFVEMKTMPRENPTSMIYLDEEPKLMPGDIPLTGVYEEQPAPHMDWPLSKELK